MNNYPSKETGQSLVVYAIALCFVVLAVAFVVGLVGISVAENFYKWCDTGSGPNVALRTNASGNVLSYSVLPSTASVTLNGQYVGSNGSYPVADGVHTVVATAGTTRTIPELALWVGEAERSCTRTTVVKRDVTVDTTGPRLHAINALLQYDGTIMVYGQFEQDLTGVQYVQLDGHDPIYAHVQADGQFSAWVPITVLTSNEIRLIALDQSGNKLSGTVTIPLPPNRWEKRNVYGETVFMQLQEPQRPALGWGLNSWVFIANGVEARTVKTNILIYIAAALLPLAAGTMIVVAFDTHQQLARKKRHAEMVQNATAAFRRCERRRWANLTNRQATPAMLLQFSNIGEFVPTSREEFQHYNDAFLCSGVWPKHPKVQHWMRMAKWMQVYQPALEKVAFLAFKKREIARAWIGVNRLPQNLPQTRLLWLAIERVWYPKCQELLSMPDGGTLFLFDAVGIRPDPALLHQVLYFNELGASNLPQSFIEMREKLFMQLIEFAETVQERWGPQWAQIVIPSIEGVTGLGMEGFNAYLVTLALARPSLVQKGVRR